MDVNDVMHQKHALGILKKSVELRTRHRMRRVDIRGSHRPDEFARYGHHTWWEADGKVIIERLCISLPDVETFNSKVIKGFVPELRSRKCFLCFRIPMFYVYMLWTFYVRFTHSHIMTMVQLVTLSWLKIPVYTILCKTGVKREGH